LLEPYQSLAAKPTLGAGMESRFNRRCARRPGLQPRPPAPRSNARRQAQSQHSSQPPRLGHGDSRPSPSQPIAGSPRARSHLQTPPQATRTSRDRQNV